ALDLGFAAGEVSKTVSIPVWRDGAPAQEPESFTVALSGPTGGATVGSARSTVNIVDPLLVTNLNDSGLGSLREASVEASSLTGRQIIRFAESVQGTISLRAELPDLANDIDLLGPGAHLLTLQPGEGSPFQFNVLRTGGEAAR